MRTKQTIKTVIFVAATFSQVSCATSPKEKEVNYEGLVSSFTSNERTKLCFWYYDGLESNRNNVYYFFSYICSPSEDYKGSRIIVKERLIIKKSELTITGLHNDGGEVKLENLEKR